MNLLNTLLNARDKSDARRISAEDRKARRKARPALDMLEERKVLSTVTSSGNFDGMHWNFLYDNVAKAATLTVTDAPGSHTIDINATHPNLNPGDPGYSPAHQNDITGIEMTDRQNDLTGGVSFAAGTKVNVVVNRLAGDNAFVNNEPSFRYTVGNRASTPSGPNKPTGPTTPTGPTYTPAAAQSGTSLGLAWRFAPDSTGGGTMYIQDVAKGADSSNPQNNPIAVNQDNGRMILDVDYSMPFYGPTFRPGAQVKVVVADHAGDIQVYDDRSSGTGGLTHKDRLQSGTIQVQGGQTLGWTMSQDVVAQKATVTITSAATDRGTYSIAPAYLNLSPGDPGYVANVNPIVGLTISDSQGNQGGVTFDQGMGVSIVTKGGATFKNSSPFAVARG